MQTINPVFLMLIPLLWCLTTLTLSRLSGWNRLAANYRFDPGSDRSRAEREGPVARYRSGRIGSVHYHSTLNFRITASGLFISVTLPFRFGHPPLLIPWSELHHVRDDTQMFSHSVRMSIGRPTLVQAVFPGWVKYHLPPRLRPATP